MTKTDLRARPMFHHTRDAIEAHLTIVFTALAVARDVQNRTGLRIRNVIRQLRPLRSATIAINGTTRPSRPPSPPTAGHPRRDPRRRNSRTKQMSQLRTYVTQDDPSPTLVTDRYVHLQ